MLKDVVIGVANYDDYDKEDRQGMPKGNERPACTGRLWLFYC